MKYMLEEDYFYQGNCSTLTQQIKSGANPEIANMDNKRALMFSEPEENACLIYGVIKALSDEDTTNARGLYSSKTKTKLVQEKEKISLFFKKRFSITFFIFSYKKIVALPYSFIFCTPLK